MKTKHIMIDIETLGISSSAVITQIGAKEFSLDNSIAQGKTFLMNVNISQNDRVIEPDTLKWWLKQAEEVRKSSVNTSSQYSLKVGLASLGEWIDTIDENSANIKFWCRGVGFDFVILDNAYKQYNLTAPWKYSNLADVRTFDSLVPKSVIDSIPRVGSHHNALDDCIFQIEYVKRALASINNK